MTLVFMAATGGAIIGAIFANVDFLPDAQMTAVEIIQFSLGVVLAGATAALAIVAISLGQYSERAMVLRSDESIRLQNEVFQKSIEALSRIESSTDTTGRRIEDIMQTFRDTTKEVVEEEFGVKDTPGQTQKMLDELQEKLLDALRRPVPRRFASLEQDEAHERRVERARALNDEEEKSKVFRERLGVAIVNEVDCEVEKIGTSLWNASGDKLAWIILKTGAGRRIGISALYNSPLMMDKNGSNFDTTMNAIIGALADDTFDAFVHAFPFELEGKYQASVDHYGKRTSGELFNKLHFLSGEPEEIAKSLSGLLA